MHDYLSDVYGFCMDKSALEIDVLKMKQEWQKQKQSSSSNYNNIEKIKKLPLKYL